MNLLVKPVCNNLPHAFLLGRVKRVWAGHGNNIVSALQNTTGLRFTKTISVNVGFCDDKNRWQGSAGHPGKKAITILLPQTTFAPYDEAILWILAHELGHRLLEQHNLGYNYKNLASESDWDYYEHKLLFVFLIDALSQALNPRQYALLMSEIPAVGYTGTSSHARAWHWANTLSATERQTLVNQAIKGRNLNCLLDPPC